MGAGYGFGQLGTAAQGTCECCCLWTHGPTSSMWNVSSTAVIHSSLCAIESGCFIVSQMLSCRLAPASSQSCSQGLGTYLLKLHPHDGLVKRPTAAGAGSRSLRRWGAARVVVMRGAQRTMRGRSEQAP